MNNITFVNNVERMFKTSNPYASLIHIEIKKKEKFMMSMADTRATNRLFMYVLMKNWWLIYYNSSYFKTVNSKAQALWA